MVEDEEDVRNLMLLHLQREGHSAVGVENSERALELIGEEKFNLLILDWMLPGISGLELCKKLRGAYPILMVTARVDPVDIIHGLDSGADDYITKPFQVSVFVARVRALLRRVLAVPLSPASGKIEVDALVLDTKTHRVTFERTPLQLTPSEFKALAALMSHAGIILSRTKLIQMIQGDGITVTERAIDTLIFGLRKNLGEAAAYIETVRGVGYRVRGDESVL